MATKDGPAARPAHVDDPREPARHQAPGRGHPKACFRSRPAQPRHRDDAETSAPPAGTLSQAYPWTPAHDPFGKACRAAFGIGAPPLLLVADAEGNVRYLQLS